MRLLYWTVYLAFITFTSNTHAAGATPGVEGGTVAGTANTSPSVYSWGNQSQQGNSRASNTNTLVGTGLIALGGVNIAQGTSTCPYCNVPLIMMGVMQVMSGQTLLRQAKEHDRSANQGQNTAFQTNGFGTLGMPDLSLAENAAVAKDPNVVKLPANLQSINNSGVVNLARGTATVDGKTYKASDFASKKAMLAAGIPKGAVDGLMDQISQLEARAEKRLNAAASTKVMSFADSGAGSGAGVGTIATDSEDGSGGSSSWTNRTIQRQREPANLSGLQRNLNGEPIGIAAENIFMMMSRRYKIKESQNEFFAQ